MQATSTITYGHTPSAPRPSAITTSCTLRSAPLRSTTPHRRRRLVGHGPVHRVAERGKVVVAAEHYRERGLDRPRLRLEQLGPRTRTEHRAAREVLHLALAVDRRVRDHGHRLLEVVGQVLALGGQAR